MAVLASYGDLLFNVQENGFRRFRRRSTLGFGEHPKLLGKPSLQNVGDKLDELSFDFTFHDALVDTQDAIGQLRQIAKDKRPLPFVFGGHYEGNFVLIDFSEVPRNIALQGDESRFIVVDFRMTLLESVDVNLRFEQPNIATINPFQFVA